MNFLEFSGCFFNFRFTFIFNPKRKLRDLNPISNSILTRLHYSKMQNLGLKINVNQTFPKIWENWRKLIFSFKIEVKKWIFGLQFSVMFFSIFTITFVFNSNDGLFCFIVYVLRIFTSVELGLVIRLETVQENVETVFRGFPLFLTILPLK